MTFFRPGDIVRFRPVGREEYDLAVRDVDAGTFDPAIRPVTYDLREFTKDPIAYNQSLEGVLHGH